MVVKQDKVEEKLLSQTELSHQLNWDQIRGKKMQAVNGDRGAGAVSVIVGEFSVEIARVVLMMWQST